MLSRSAKLNRSSPETSASFAAFSAQKVRKKLGRVAGKFSTIARPCSSLPMTRRPPGPVTLAIQEQYLGIANGQIADRFGWLTPVPLPAKAERAAPVLSGA